MLSPVACCALFGTAGQGVSGPGPATCAAHRGEATASSGLFSGTEWKTPHSYLSLCNTYHRTLFKGSTMLGEKTLQRTIHAVGVHIAEAKRDHTGQPGSTRGDQLPKAKVVDQHNTSLLAGLLHNV